jgi:hypothetical protein
MKVETEVDRLRAEIKARVEKIKWLRSNRAKLEALPKGSFCGDKLDFDNLPHAEVVKVIRALGGKWKKTPTHASDNRIDYSAELGPMQVRCYSGEPPPSCRIIEVEELVPERVIPASVRKVRKMVCSPEFAATIAIAAEKGASNAT